MAFEKKYYSGAQVFDIIKELPGKEFLSMLNTFAKERVADVVEVVRCKDCKHNPHNTTDDVCPFVDENGYVKQFPDDDGFCKWGERRDALIK